MPHKDRKARLSCIRAHHEKHRPSPAPMARGDLPPLGAMRISEDGTKVQCHVCGRWMAALNSHLRTHGLDADSYKAEFDLPRTASLLPPAVQESYRAAAVARDQVAAIFAAQGCVLEKSSDVDGVERWGGHKGAVLCEAIGPEHDISRIYMLHALIKGDAPGALDAVVRVNEMRKGVFPNWEDGGKWLVAAYSNGSGDTIIKDGLEVEAKLMPTLGIGLGIRAQAKK